MTIDENLVEIDRVYHDDILDVSKFKKMDNTPDINEVVKKLLNNLDYSVEVYYPIKNSNDFSVSFFNNQTLIKGPIELNEIKGIYLSDVFVSSENVLLDIMRDVYNTGKSQNLYFDFYENDILYRRVDVKIIVLDGFVYFLSKNKDDYSSLFSNEKNLFENEVTPIIVYQNKHFVKCNKKYLDIFKQNDITDVIGKEMGYSGFLDEATVSYINKKIEKVLKEKLSSYEFPLELKINRSLFYFNITCNYIVYQGEPAVLCIFNDITKQELTKRERDKKAQEASFLEENLELIQSATDTGIAYLFNGKIIRSSKLYEIIEREHYDEDLDRDITEDFVIEEDKHILEENYAKLKYDHNAVDFIVRISTAKGNLKYIHCYIRVKYVNDVVNGFISFYRDVTDEQVYLKDLKIALDESLKLKNKLENIQRITKTAMSYTNSKGTLDWTLSTAHLLKVDPEEFENYHGTHFDVVFDEDIHHWHEAYEKCSPEFPEANALLRIINAKGELAYIKNYVLCEYDEDDNEIGHINFYQDVTEQITRENMLTEALNNSQQLEKNLEKIQKISKTSMSYINDKTKETTWFVKGYSILDVNPEKYSGNMADYVINEDKNIWMENHVKCTPENPEVSFVQRIISDKSELKYIHTFVAYEFDKEGNKISHINFFQDITEEVEKENKLKESLKETLKLQNSLNRIQSLSKTVIGYSDGSKYSKWTPEIFDLLEIEPENYENDMNNIIRRFVLDEDLLVRNEAVSKLTSEHPDAKFNQRIRTGKGNIKYLKTIIHQEYDHNGNLIDRISFNQDMTREIEYQNQLETALNDKEVLLTEVHHRVKNNLQIIISLINLDRNYEASPESILNDTENRIYAMALIHEKIYGSTSLSDVDMKDYIESLVNSLFDTYWSDIKFHSDIDPLELNMEEAIPLGLIINELVTNTINHAFPDDGDGDLYIKFKKEDKHYTLIVKDDGVGLPDNFSIDNLTSLGLIVVQNLTLQIGGLFTILNGEGSGFKIEFDEV